MLWAIACWRWVPWGDAGEELLGSGSGGGSGSGSSASKTAADDAESDDTPAPAAVTTLAGGYQSV